MKEWRNESIYNALLWIAAGLALVTIWIVSANTMQVLFR